MRTRQAEPSLEPGGLVAWIFVILVFHSPLMLTRLPGKTLSFFILDPDSLSMYERVRGRPYARVDPVRLRIRKARRPPSPRLHRNAVRDALSRREAGGARPPRRRPEPP